jgi:hypothetical protein
VEAVAGSSVEIAFRFEATLGRFAAGSGALPVSVDGFSAFFFPLFLASGGFLVFDFLYI